MSKLKHSSEDDQVNGGLSPAKIPKLDEDNLEELSPEARIARVKDFFKGVKAPPIIKPKPKPRKPTVTVTEEDMDEGTSSEPRSPETPDVIQLNPESLRQFGGIREFDFDAVIRRQMLDNTPQKERAALSQSKGLKDRRLPANFASKVPDDYQERRRANTYNISSQKSPERGAGALDRSLVDEPDSGILGREEAMTEEERRKKILSKMGVQQSNPLAALGSILRKSTGRGSGRGQKSPKKASTPTDSPVLKQKSLKTKSPKDSPDPSRKISEPTPPKSPKAFRFLRRSSSRGSGRGKKGNGLDSSVEDLKSETTSVSSLNVQSTVKEEEEPMEVQLSKSLQVERRTQTSPTKANGRMDTTSSTKPESPMTTSTLSETSTSHRKTDSGCFKELEVEPLFGRDSVLFDTGEIDALLGKEKGRTPERKGREKTPEHVLEKIAEKEAQKKKEPGKTAETPKRTEPVVPKRIEPTATKRIEPTTAKRIEPTTAKPKPGNIRARLQMYESHSKSYDEPEKKPLLTSTPKSEAEPTKKSSGLFENVEPEEDELFVTTTKKEEEKPKTDLEKKKADLFSDELFQDDLKPEKPKPAPKKDIFGSPKRDLFGGLKREPIGSPKRELSGSPKREPIGSPKREPIGSPKREPFGIPKEDSKEVSASPKSRSKTPEGDLGPASASPKSRSKTPEGDLGPASASPKSRSKTPEGDLGPAVKRDPLQEDKSGLKAVGIMDYEESPFGAKTIEDRKRRRDAETKTEKKGIFEEDKDTKGRDEVDSLFGVKPFRGSGEKAMSPERKREKVDEIVDSIFGKPEEAKSPTVKDGDDLEKIAGSIFGEEELKRSPKAGRRAVIKVVSPEPEKMEVSEPTEDPLGAISMKIEKESEDRQKEKESSKEDKSKKTNLFEEELMEADSPSDRVSSKDGKSKKTNLFGEELMEADSPSDRISSKEGKSKKTNLFGEELMEADSPSDRVSSKDGKSKKTNLFGEELIEPDTLSDRVSVSSSSDQKSEKSATPEVAIADGIQVEESTAPVVEGKGEDEAVPSKDEEKSPTETQQEKDEPVEEAKMDAKETKTGVEKKDLKKSRSPEGRSKIGSRVGDSKSTSSPRTSRSPRTTSADLVKNTAKKPSKEEKKEAEDGGKPSWMVELQKRKEGRKTMEKEPKPAAPTAAAAKETKKEEAMPEWQKKILERKKKTTETKPSYMTRSERLEKSSASTRADRSERLEKSSASTRADRSERLEKSSASTRADRSERLEKSSASTRADNRSPRSERKSANATTRSPVSSRIGRDTTTSAETRIRSPRRARDESEKSTLASKEKVAATPKDKDDKPSYLSKKPEATVDTKYSRLGKKPSFERSTKPKIEVSSKKTDRKSDSGQETSLKEEGSPEVSSKEPSPKEASPVEKEPSPKEPSPVEKEPSPKEPSPVEKEPSPRREIKLNSKETVVKKLEESSRKESKPSDKEERKSPEHEDDDDVFISKTSSEKAKDKRALSPLGAAATAALEKRSGSLASSGSQHGSTSSDANETGPYRSRNMSRSPTPTPPTGPLKLPAADDIPEWKKKLMERRKSSGSDSKPSQPKAKTTTAKNEPEVPSWKKELLAKRRAKSPEVKKTAELKPRDIPRSSTISVTTSRTSPRSSRAGKKKEEPDFMKEFKQRKQRLSNKD